MDRKRPGPRRPRSASKHDRIIPTQAGDCRGKGPALAAIRIIRESEQSTLFRARNNIDLLLYHVPTDRYVVVELKAGKFKPEHLGQLAFYVSVVNDKMRLPRQRPTVGILVCGSKNEHTVRYALDGAAQPLAVTSYTYEALPEAEQQALPSPEAIVTALELDND